MTAAAAAWQRVALGSVREQIARLREEEAELERDLGIAADPLAPLPFNVIEAGVVLPFSHPAGVNMPPLPTLQEATAELNAGIKDARAERKAIGMAPDADAEIKAAVSWLTTAERHVLQAHPFLGGAV